MIQNYEELIELINSSSVKYDTEKIIKAYNVAHNAHKEQIRKSGTPYITHPVAVAGLVVDMQLDTDSVCAALLHDVVEDTTCTDDQIKDEFGEQVALLVDGVTKLDKINFSSKEERDMVNLRKMFLAMTSDIRVIMIKFADRLHNLSTLISMSEDKQREKARETLNIFAPLAHRLGMYKIKWELEDTSLKYLDPIAYYEIVEGINQKRNEREDFIAKIKHDINEKLTEANIKCSIDGRPKHFYSIYRKMFTQNKTLDQIYDLFAIRIITETVSDCYAALGIAHELYKPMPGRFKDYIAMPKPNMYQSLHTTVIGEDGQPFEIQIRTKKMHEFAENGIAAHWKYKEGSTEHDSELDKKLMWVKQLLDVQNDFKSEEEFVQALKIDMFTDQVFVFSPKGDVYSLPLGSTPIDFAFAIHSAVGYKMQGAKINGKIVNLDYQLKNGDIVNIITSSSVHGPSKDWLKIVKTGQARTKINAWFKKENRAENIIKGKESVEKELRKEGLSYQEIVDDGYIQMIVKRYGYSSEDDLYANITYGGIQLSNIISKIKEEYKKKNIKQFQNDIPSLVTSIPEPSKSADTDSIDGIIVKGVDNCLIRFSKCCSPVPGDKIIGYITRGRGVSVHRQDCSNVAAIISDPEEKARLIDVSWSGGKSNSYITNLRLVCNDRDGIVVDVIGIINDMKLPLTAVNARSAKGNVCLIDLTISINSTGDLDKITNKLNAISDVIEISRN